jgi:hypothetical protein
LLSLSLSCCHPRRGSAVVFAFAPSKQVLACALPDGLKAWMDEQEASDNHRFICRRNIGFIPASGRILVLLLFPKKLCSGHFVAYAVLVNGLNFILFFTAAYYLFGLFTKRKEAQSF